MLTTTTTTTTIKRLTTTLLLTRPIMTDIKPNTKPKLNVHNFPRPPLCEKTNRHLLIKWNDQTIAETTDAYWVLETTHPPTYYLPPSSVNSAAATITPVPKYSTMCEWKGAATYHDIKLNGSSAGGAAAGQPVKRKIWSYESPTPRFAGIKGYLCFYASGVPWRCFVDGEEVVPQEGDFYGGWVTSELEGRMKGGPGTWGW